MLKLEQSPARETGNPEYRAILLQDFIGKFTPPTWTKPVNNVIGRSDYTILPQDIAEMEHMYKAGTLDDFLATKYRFPAVRAAITEYFSHQ